jgi:hypothetical protein
MASTQWETILHNPAAGPIREEDLQVFWRDTLAQGAVYRRIDVTDPRGDAQAIIDHILERHVVATQIQKELVELNKRVKETEAAQKLQEALEKWLGDSQTQELSQEKEEQLKEFPVEPGVVDWIKGLFRLKSRPDLTRCVRLFSERMPDADFPLTQVLRPKAMIRVLLFLVFCQVSSVVMTMSTFCRIVTLPMYVLISVCLSAFPIPRVECLSDLADSRTEPFSDMFESCSRSVGGSLEALVSHLPLLLTLTP